MGEEVRKNGRALPHRPHLLPTEPFELSVGGGLLYNWETMLWLFNDLSKPLFKDLSTSAIFAVVDGRCAVSALGHHES